MAINIKECLVRMHMNAADLVKDMVCLESAITANIPECNVNDLVEYIAKRIAVLKSLQHWEHNRDMLQLALHNKYRVTTDAHVISLYYESNRSVLIGYGEDDCAMCGYARHILCTIIGGHYRPRYLCTPCPAPPRLNNCNTPGSPWRQFADCLEKSAIEAHSDLSDYVWWGRVNEKIVAAAGGMVQWVKKVEQHLIDNPPDDCQEIIQKIFG